MATGKSTDTDSDLDHTDEMAGRILDAAATCFYRDGIWASGVDTLAAEAGISKRTLYNHFDSKDQVIAAYLQQREEQWQAKLQEAWDELEPDADPMERVVAYVRAYARPAGREAFRGSAFINAAAELADEESQALDVITHSLANMESGILDILTEGGYPDAERLARRVLYLVEGAVAVGGARRDSRVLGDVEEIIREMLTMVAE